MPNDKPARLSQGTTVSLGLAVVVLAAMAGVYWRIADVINGMTTATNELTTSLAVVEERLTSMDEKLGEIAIHAKSNGQFMSSNGSRILLLEREASDIRRRVEQLENK